MCQRKYAFEIVKEYSLLRAKPIKCSMETNRMLGLSTGMLLGGLAQYQRLVGKLIYLTIIRPKLRCSVHILLQFM